MPLRDSVMAIADESYFDWIELPEAPSDLVLAKEQAGVRLTWKAHGGNPDFVSVERRIDEHGPWEAVAKLPATQPTCLDERVLHGGGRVSYRVQAGNNAGRSAYSNVVTQGQ